MKRTILPALPFIFAACGEPVEVADPVDDPASEAVALFEAVTEAVLEAETVEYSYELEGLLLMGDTVRYRSTGLAMLQKGSDTVEASIYLRYTMNTMPEDLTIEGEVVSGGGRAAFHNTTSGTYTYGLAEDGGDAMVLRDAIPQGAILREFIFTEGPFAAELDADGYTILEQETLNGHLCHVIAVEIHPFSSTWWINTETMLPVQNRISVWSPDGSQGMEYTVTLTDLVVNSHLPENIFELECPIGIAPEQVFGSVSAGSFAPGWTLSTPGGEMVSLEDYRGRVVVMDFWATWCGPCRMVMPFLQELHEEHGEEVAVLGINVWESGDPVEFMEQNGYTYSLLLNGDDVAAAYLVEAIPTLYVIAQDGTVALHAVGADPANEEALLETVGTLLSL
jgi:thiol-disulfide isomerase/thioredoxin